MQEKKNQPNRLAASKPWGGVGFEEDLSLYFINEKGERIAEILDGEGRFLTFPGVEESEALRRELDGQRIRPVLHYELYLKARPAGGWRMVWTVRPDGRYWMDSWGFGEEDYDSLDLYADLDEKGRFLGPFRLYAVGDTVKIKEEEV